MNTIIYFLLAFGYFVLLIWGLALSKNNLWNLTNVLLLVIVGLVYDNLIIALGKFIGEGELLKGLSYPRFWLHALFTPTLILFAWSICNKLDLPWAKKTHWKVIFGFLTIGLILYELLTSVMNLELKANHENGVLNYESIESTSPVMVIFVTLVLLIVGIILLKKFHFPWLLIGTIIMILGSLLAIWMKTFPIMNILEILLITSLVLTKQLQVKESKIVG
ncbi:hypothetical protein [Ureibacillus chungkukjangi]|uniref:Phospholipid phosphatase n=1 Tax=Ureibacillus chungkukjangi TaxID=1202712 RepID=A0A318U8T4_9BACL|nr:hypothetical protein [Ureibacillus chungkukjangi]PYF08409.1 hypothetical protein BJ095_102175 [Ureibacillus chungkukjangi]